MTGQCPAARGPAADWPIALHLRIRSRSARLDNRRKESPTASPGRSQVEPYQRIALIRDAKLVTVEGGPHNIAWTHPDEVNKALLDFLAE